MHFCLTELKELNIFGPNLMLALHLGLDRTFLKVSG